MRGAGGMADSAAAKFKARRVPFGASKRAAVFLRCEALKQGG